MKDVTKCKYCALGDYSCVCGMVDSFFEQIKDIPKAAGPKAPCLACYFDPCQCSKGLAGKKLTSGDVAKLSIVLLAFLVAALNGVSV